MPKRRNESRATTLGRYMNMKEGTRRIPVNGITMNVLVAGGYRVIAPDTSGELEPLLLGYLR